MTNEKAWDDISYYSGLVGKVLSPIQQQRYIDGMKFLIESKDDADCMWGLAGYYKDYGAIDDAMQYYELAIATGGPGPEGSIAWVWYNGDMGVRDYKKAFEYFSKSMESGSLSSEYMVAQMYHKGQYVARDEARYERMIEDLASRPGVSDSYEYPESEIYLSLAQIRKRQGKQAEAADLCLRAKARVVWYAEHIGVAFESELMGRIIDELYSLISFDEDTADIFDLYYLLKTPHKIKLRYEDQELSLESSEDEGRCAINFNGKWFRDRYEFYARATIGDRYIYSMCDDLYGIEVIV